MYKLFNQLGTNTLIGIKRLEDNAYIPFDPDNTDYQEYLRWLEAGNTPEPAEENQ
jgi:hypothetical protein